MYDFNNLFLREVPENVGVSSEGIYNFICELQNLRIDIHSVIMIKNGRTVFEAYGKPFDKNTLHRMFSVTKSFVSVAVGFLEQDGKLSLDDKICKFFGEKLPENVHSFIKETTVKDMLRMASPHCKTAFKKGKFDDWVKAFFCAEPDKIPGTVFCYDTSASHTLAALVEKLSEKSLLEYLREKILDCIQFSKKAYCITDGMGVSQGGSGLMALPRDIAVFGYVIMNCRKFEKEMGLPCEYIEKAVSKQIDTFVQGVCTDEKQGYGYHFWRTRNNGFVMYGMAGQLVLCLPEYDFILVTTADTQEVWDGVQKIYDAFWKNVYYGMKHKGVLQYENKRDISEIEKSIEIFCLKNKYDYIKTFGGKTFSVIKPDKEKFKQNEIIQMELSFGIGSAKKSNKDGILKIKFVSDEKTGETIDKEIFFGVNQNIENLFPFYGTAFQNKCFSSAAFLNKSDFVLRIAVIGEEILSVYLQVSLNEDLKTGCLFLKQYGGENIWERKCFVLGVF